MYTCKGENTTVIGRDSMHRLEQEMRLRNFSPKTIQAYLYYNRELLRFANYKSVLEISNQDIKDYLDFLIKNKSRATVDAAINAIKFYYKNILERKFFTGMSRIVRPKREKTLPVVLSRAEVRGMIEALNNPKHKCMLMLLYGCGLRISELVNIKMADMDYGRTVLMVRAGKGNKDRYVSLPKILLPVLKNQQLLKLPADYLFSGRDKARSISLMSVQKTVKKASKTAGLVKNVSAHTLRHSYATHLLESGLDIRYIQALLGHARLETTQLYTRVAKSNTIAVTSPLDS